jgi:tetratricopeptide (TPR) repeat protein
MDERIEDYFSGTLSESDKNRFEADLKSDPTLVEDVGFYLAARKAAAVDLRTDQLVERHKEWQQLQKPANNYRQLRTWYSVAAAVAFIAFALAWYMLRHNEPDLKELANGYILENFTTLSVQMGSNSDSIQLAINNYNKGQYATTMAVCNAILLREPDNAEAKKIAGIVSLKLLDYDNAISYFHKLAEQNELFANPGKFYEAIALIRSGVPEHRQRAEELLNEVIDEGLDGKEEAIKWKGK